MFMNSEFIDIIFEHIRGVIVVDSESKIQYLSPDWARRLKVKREEVLGLHVRDVYNTTKMDMVVNNQEPILADLFLHNDEYIICNRIPLFKDNKLVGAVAFQVGYQDDLIKKFHRELNKVSKELNLIKKKK